MKDLLIDISPFKSVLKESKERPGIFEVEGILQRANTENQNGRNYSKPILEREISKFIDEFVNNGNAYGELDHPDSAVVSLKNASHIIKELWWDGDEVKGKIELLNTPAGNIVKEIMKAGHTIGISSRGTGSVQQTNEGTMEVQPDFELITWDFVSNPSTQGAFMNSVSLNESAGGGGYYRKLNEIIEEILRI